MMRGFSEVLIATGGVGPPPQKEGPRRRARAKSHGLSDTRTLVSVTPSLAPVQVRREARVRHEHGIVEIRRHHRCLRRGDGAGPSMVGVCRSRPLVCPNKLAKWRRHSHNDEATSPYFGAPVSCGG
jgi:hypothetical protein